MAASVSNAPDGVNKYDIQSKIQKTLFFP